ncbi:type II toxin-antitoxin system RelE/ParE family toxin [Methylorubrum zatmanii]
MWDEKKPRVGNVSRSPRALQDLLDLWNYVADHNEAAADRLLDRIESVMVMLSDNPHAGRSRPELARSLRSFPVGNFVLFYCPVQDGITLIRVLNGYRDIGRDDIEVR